MKALRVVIFIIVGLAQLSVPASIVWKREQTLSNGRVWKFKTAPVDPVDAIRGRYVALRFGAETIPGAERPEFSEIQAGTIVYATLREDTDGFAQVDRLSKTPLIGDNVMKIEKGYWHHDADHVSFPFNRFWVTEKNAAAVEKAYVENSTQQKQNVYVTVRVREGDAAIDEMYIDNQPLPEYLRAQAAKK